MSKVSTVKKTILIASSSLDYSWIPIAEKLTKRGYDVLSYEADKVADGGVRFKIFITQDGGMQVVYGDRQLCLNDIAAAWFRRPNTFSGDLPDLARQITMDRERKAMQYALWDAISDNVWLNAPKRMNHAEYKLSQLTLAAELGLNIPDTLVTNSWLDVNKSLPEEIILKPHYTSLFGRDGRKLAFTKPYKNPQTLPHEASPFPGLWQPQLQKAREWRITIVGNESFDAVVETGDKAKADWRKYQHTEHVLFKKGVFPDEEKRKCFAYLRKLGLRYGAFDFIEDQDGKLTFLECNPNGQYGWLEYGALDFPISDAIVNELTSIAEEAFVV